jgi:hypothetical protein
VTARLLFAIGALFWIGPAGAQPAPASLEGQVVNAKTGAPVRFAIVTLGGPFSERVPTPPRQPGRVKMAQVTADDQGRFAFRDVAPGNYALRARREGYEPALYRASTNSRELLPVREGEAVNGIAFKLAPCGVIAGKVVNERGEPLQGVELMALRYYYGAWLWRLPVAPEVPLKVYTNDLGEFRISNLTAGPYIVKAAAPPQPPQTKGSAPPTYPSIFYPDALSPEAANPVTVANGEVSRANLTLRPGPAFRITGVIDAGGSSLEVCFGLVPKQYNSALPQVIGLVARPANSSQFTIYDVPPGSYVLSAAICRGTEPLGAIQPIEVAGNIEGLKIQLTPGQRLSGVVKTEGVNAAGVRMVLRSPEFLTTPMPQAVAAQDGSFAFEHVAPRRYLVEFSGLPPNAYVKSVKYGGREAPAAGFEWTPDASLEIILSSQGAAQFSGSVLDKSGRPAPYPMITVIPADGGPAESAKDVMGDENGNFTFAALRPGTYKALAWEDRFNPLGLESADPMLPLLFETNARTVTLAPGAPQTARLSLNTQEDVDRARAAARMTPPKNP